MPKRPRAIDRSQSFHSLAIMTNDQIAVLEVVAQHAQRPPAAIARTEGLIALGIDSLKFIVVILEIEQRLDRSVFDIENVGQLRTVGDILDLVGITTPSSSRSTHA
jgi:acyl carrier protein